MPRYTSQATKEGRKKKQQQGRRLTSSLVNIRELTVKKRKAQEGKDRMGYSCVTTLTLSADELQ